MAALVEQSGFDFYARLTSRTADPRARNGFRYLRDDEAVHKSWFLSQLRAGGNTPRGDLSAGLRDRLDRDFLEPTEGFFSSGSADDTDSALRVGSELARRSINLYSAMRDAVTPGQKAELGRIITEEEAHANTLESLRSVPEQGAPRGD